MKKSILNLGKSLNKAEQKNVYGGGASSCNIFTGCPKCQACAPTIIGGTTGVCVDICYE